MWNLETCTVCGKEFVPSVEHSLTDGRGGLVCSCRCSMIAHENHKECANERMLKRQREYWKKKKEARLKGEDYVPKPRFTKPVCVVKKDDWTVMSRYPSMTAASKATGFSITTISHVCNGMKQTRGIYTFAFENPDGSPSGNQSIWGRKPACKPVIQFNLRGEFVARYDSQIEAAKATGFNQACISKCCKHEYRQTNGFVFMFESEFNDFDEKIKEPTIECDGTTTPKIKINF